MAGKMNWTRVQKENQSSRHGSEYMDMEPDLLPRADALNTSRKDSLGKFAIPGCTCGKRVGFSTPHLKSCPLGKGAVRQSAPHPRKSTPRQAAAAPKPEQIQTFMQFADCVCKVGELPALTRWISDLLKKIGSNANIDNDARKKLNQLAVELFRIQRLNRPSQSSGT